MKKEMMTSNAMIRKLTEENLLLRKESSQAEVRQLRMDTRLDQSTNL